MIDQLPDGDSARAYYHVLEADETGRPPDDPLFKKKDWSAFQVIAKRGDKVLYDLYIKSFNKYKLAQISVFLLPYLFKCFIE